MQHAPGGVTGPAPAGGQVTTKPIDQDLDLIVAARTALRTSGLVVLTGAPGAGRSTALRELGEAFPGQAHLGGALAMLRGVPALPLARALRVRLPTHDPALLAEAVRSRVRQGLLLIDDLQWADPITMAAVPAIAVHCRIAVTLRTPHRLPAESAAALRAVASAWLTVSPLTADDAAALARRTVPGLPAAAVADLVRRAGGVPLAVTALARHAGHGRAGAGGFGAGGPGEPGGAGEADLTYAVASALADLTRPARTALAALGLLGRPATARLLGEGVAELLDAALVTALPTPAGDNAVAAVSPRTAQIAAVSPYTAEVAAGLLDQAERRALHLRLADHLPAREAVRHLAAAGADERAYRVAVTAARRASTAGERAELLLLACDLPARTPAPDVRYAAARDALTIGRPGACLRVLDRPGPADHPTGGYRDAIAVLRAEALLQRHQPAAAVRAVADVPDTADDDALAGRDRIRLLAALTEGGAAAGTVLDHVLKIHGDPPRAAGLRAAVAAVRAATRDPGWESALAAAAAAAGTGGDALAARWSAWLLVETLTADARLDEAARTADAAAGVCATDLAYSWQTRFVAAGLWCAALRGAGLDEVVRRAGDLMDRTLPAVARGYASAAVSLAEADAGLLASARGRLRGLVDQPPATAGVLDWVAREAAWLDGQPDRAHQRAASPPAPPLVDGLRRITARWAQHDAGTLSATGDPGRPAPPSGGESPTGAPHPITETLRAWSAAAAAVNAAAGDGAGFARAALAWRDLAVREEVRCLLAQGVLAGSPDTAVPALLAAERLATEAGLVVLLGRTRRALRRHAVRRDARGDRAGDHLTARERDVLRLVAAGEPTRRIAGQLGISRETVETHIRAGMRKLGARTRTEAAALAIETLR